MPASCRQSYSFMQKTANRCLKIISAAEERFPVGFSGLIYDALLPNRVYKASTIQNKTPSNAENIVSFDKCSGMTTILGQVSKRAGVSEY